MWIFKVILPILGLVFIIISEQLGWPLRMMRIFYIVYLFISLLDSIVSYVRSKKRRGLECDNEK